MNLRIATEITPSFPRYLKIAGHWVSAYKIFLCIGIYTGALVSAALAQGSGISPLRMGLACVSCGFVGMIGARLFHLFVFARDYTHERFWSEMWNSKRSGWSVFGGLLIVPYSLLPAYWLAIPLAVYWDHMIFGIVAGAVSIRFGCICNGCCGGKPTTRWYGVWMHDCRGNRQRRIPVQWLEIGWWLLAAAGLFMLRSQPLPAGTYALGALSWYGFGRFFLEPMREHCDLVAGRVRINQVVAGLLAVLAVGTLIYIAQPAFRT